MMNIRYFSLFVSLVTCLSFQACGGQEEEGPISDNGAVIIIGSGDTLITPNITAPSGAQIAVINYDDSPHVIVSATSPASFEDTGAFEANISSASDDSAKSFFTLPAAAAGTQFYFYCAIHREGMSPAAGTITIE